MKFGYNGNYYNNEIQNFQQLDEPAVPLQQRRAEPADRVGLQRRQDHRTYAPSRPSTRRISGRSTG